MDTTTRAGTPLRQRMIEDMRMRKLEPRTQEAYIRAVRKLTVYLKRPPDTATVEDLRGMLQSDDLQHTLGLLEEEGYIELVSGAGSASVPVTVAITVSGCSGPRALRTVLMASSSAPAGSSQAP